MESNPIYGYIERLSELLRVDARQAGAKHGIQPVQLEALHYLSICNRYSDTPMAVTEYLGQTKGTVSQTLKVLEKKELLTKQQDDKDKRVSHLKISAKGLQLLKKLVPTQMFINAEESLSEKDQAQITTALNQLLTTLLQVNELKSFGICRSCHYNQLTEDNGYFCKLLHQPLSIIDTQLICREHRPPISES